MKIKCNLLADRLNQLLTQFKGQSVSVKIVVEALAGRGQAVLLVLLVLPFCLPIQIPGLSTPFGIILIFIGLRIALGHRAWIPQSLLNKEIAYAKLDKIAKLAIKITHKLSFFTSTRLIYMVNNPFLHMIHGFSIALMASLLALPVPIPFTNLLAAYPILFFGLALLEDDGVMIIISYFFVFICLAVFTLLVLFGKEFFQSVLN